MPSNLPLQCLFCKHLNLSDTIFCTVCSKQLSAGPCPQCGAIDDLSAKNCHKCGASFTLPAQPEHQASLASAITATGSAASTRSDTRPADMLPTQLVRGKADAAPQFQTRIQKSPSATDLNLTRSRQRWLAAIAMLLAVLAMDIFAVYFYYAEPEQLVQAEIEKTTVAMQATPEQSVEPKSSVLNPPSALIPVQAILMPEAVTPRRTTPGQGLEFDSSRVSPQMVNLLAMRPVPATAFPDKTGQESPQLKECPQAVATLGLCNAPVTE